MEIRTQPERISWSCATTATSFDPDAVATPDFDRLPESGLGIFIIKAFMNIRYRPGRPNVLTLSKTLGTRVPEESAPSGNPSEGEP